MPRMPSGIWTAKESALAASDAKFPGEEEEEDAVEVVAVVDLAEAVFLLLLVVLDPVLANAAALPPGIDRLTAVIPAQDQGAANRGHSDPLQLTGTSIDD